MIARSCGFKSRHLHQNNDGLTRRKRSVKLFFYIMLLCPYVNYPGFSGQKPPFYRADTAQIQHGYSTPKRLKYKRAAPIMERLFFFLCSYAMLFHQPAKSNITALAYTKQFINTPLAWIGHPVIESLQRHSNQFCDTFAKILSNPLQLISEGNVIDGWLEFGFNINRLDTNELYGRPILNIIPKPTDLEMCFSLEDCKEELKFLRTHNTYQIRKEMKPLDVQKLSYLVALGSLNDPAYLEERKKLIKSILRLNNAKPPKQ